MSPLDRLLSEAIPQRPDPAPPRPRPYQQYWTPAERDAHWAALCHAVGTPDAKRPAPTT